MHTCRSRLVCQDKRLNGFDFWRSVLRNGLEKSLNGNNGLDTGGKSGEKSLGAWRAWGGGGGEGGCGTYLVAHVCHMFVNAASVSALGQR